MLTLRPSKLMFALGLRVLALMVALVGLCMSMPAIAAENATAFCRQEVDIRSLCTEKGRPIVEVDSLVELQALAYESNQCVRLKPGTYSMADILNNPSVLEKNKSVLAATVPLPWAQVATLLFLGNNNLFLMDGVTINIPTNLFKNFGSGRGRGSEMQLQGDRNTLYGVHLVDQGTTVYEGGNIHNVTIEGDYNNVCSLKTLVSGSRPYGYGNLLGLGNEFKLPFRFQKHGGFNIQAVTGTRLKNVEVKSRAYNHGIAMHGSQDTIIADTLVEGVTRSTTDMLKEKTGPFASALVNYRNYITKATTPPGIMKSLSEDGIRSYLTEDVEDGIFKPNGKISIYNTTVRGMRRGFSLQSVSSAYVENSAAYENEINFAIGSNVRIVNSRGDSLNGPLLRADYGGENNQVELTYEPRVEEKRETFFPILAQIEGKNSTYVIKSANANFPKKQVLLKHYYPLLDSKTIRPNGSASYQNVTFTPERLNIDIIGPTPTYITATPSAISCKLSGPATTTPGGSIALSWTTTNNPVSGTIKQGGVTLVASVALPKGTGTITAPAAKGRYAYVLSLMSATGELVACDRDITVVAPPITPPSTKTLPAPTVSATPGVYQGSVQISFNVPRSSFIRYTINGVHPTCTTGLFHSGAFTLISSGTVKAIACPATAVATTTLPSPVVSFVYTITPKTTLPTPTATVDASPLSLTTAIRTLSGTASNATSIVVSLVGSSRIRFSPTVSISGGRWEWTTPEALPNGTYYVSIKTLNRVLLAEGQFTVSAPATASATIDSDSLTSTSATRTLKGSATNADVIYMSIRGGDVVLTPTVSVTGGRWEWTIPSELPVGRYGVKVRAPDRSVIASGNFTVSTPAPTVRNDYQPRGYIGQPNQGNQSCSISGWTCDPDLLSRDLTVEFYEGSTKLGQAQTNFVRPDTAAVAAACGATQNTDGTYTNGYTGTKGFRVVLNLPKGNYFIDARAVDVDSAGKPTGTKTPLLRTSTYTSPVVCDAATLTGTLPEAVRIGETSADTTPSTVSTPEVLGAKATPLTHSLVQTWAGPEVITLQTILKQKGYLTHEVTGYFGTLTKTAVQAFQTANGIEALGIVGPKTRALLNR